MLESIEHIQAGTAHIVQLHFQIRITVRRADIDFLLMSVGFKELLFQLLIKAVTAHFIDSVHRASPSLNRLNRDFHLTAGRNIQHIGIDTGVLCLQCIGTWPLGGFCYEVDEELILSSR